MNIKFNKLFKAAFLFFIIFVMVFNSFAAISVSDGSAFVTKAEFSADLNNLSNRMSALENSIDAKIDSLVSSYLSRNGIWNGEKQTVANSSQNNLSYFFAALGFGSINTKWSTDSTANSKTFFECTADNRIPANGKAASNIYKAEPFGEGTYTIIDELTKSGLVCINYLYYCGTGSPKNSSRFRTNNGIGRSGWASTSSSYGWSAPLRWEFVETNQSDSQVGDSLFSVSQPFSNTSIVPDLDGHAKIVYTNVTTSFYAFVSKGNKIRVIASVSGADFVLSGRSGNYVGMLGYNDDFTQSFGIFSTITVKNVYVY